MAAGPTDDPQSDDGRPAPAPSGQGRPPAPAQGQSQGQDQDAPAKPDDGKEAAPQGDKGKDDKDADKKDADKKDGDGKDKKGLLHNPIVLASGVAVLGLLLIGGLLFWLHARNFQTTDDAFVDAHIVRLAPQIAGRVTEVMADDNQLVRPNQPLVTIDSADAQSRVAEAVARKAQAQAEVDNARVQISVAQSGYQQALADAASARAQAENAARDLARYRHLQQLNPAAVAQQQIDQAQTQARQSAAQQDSAEKAARAKSDQVVAARTQVASGESQVRAAQSQVQEAQINLGYAGIVAPVAGHVAQKTVAVGNYVQAGTQLLAIVPLDVWITANFKETQLGLMRPGQPALIKVDACPGAKIQGHVDSIQRGAGQAFAILPAENATGNFVKVVQRVPVKIVLDNPPRDCPLGPGMSVEPRVRVR